VAVVCAIALTGVLGAASVNAQSNGFLLIRKADAKDPSKVQLDFVWTGAQSDISGLKIQQGGNDVKVLGGASELKTDKAIVIVIDSGPGMDKDGALVSARKGATDLINSSPDGTNFAVVQAGDKADLRADMSTDKATLLTAINGSGGTGGIGPTKGSAVWSALNVAGSVLKQNKTLQPNVVLIVGDNDTVSPKDEPLGRNAVSSAGATIWVNQRLGFMDPAPYDALVARSAGRRSPQTPPAARS
jgi:hypothetical protein